MARPTKIKGDKIDQIAKKFAELHGAPKNLERPNNCITVAEYAEYAQISEGTAWKWLNGLYKKGLVVRHKWGRTCCYELNESTKK